MKMKGLLPFGLLLFVIFTHCTSRKKDENAQAPAVVDSSAIKLNVVLTSLSESAILCTEISKAASRSTNPELRSVGERFANINAALLKEIQDLATARKIDLPDSLPAENMKRVNYMNKQTGAEFDKRVTRMMVSEHRTFFTIIRRTRDLNDNEVKAFVERNRETIISMRKDLQSLPKMKGPDRSKAEDERPS